MRKHFVLALMMAVFLSASMPAAAGRKDAPPPEPTFIEQLIQAVMGRYDTWLMPEIKGTL